MTLALLLTLKLSVTVIIFGIGLDSTPGDTMRLLRRPSLLLRSLLAMYVLVPLAAFALIHLLSPSPGVQAGLLVLAVSAGAPLLPRKLLGIGDGGYIFSLVSISSVLAIVAVPLWLAVLAPQFAGLPHVALERVAWGLAQSFFLPLLAGMLVRRLFPGFSRNVGGRLVGVAGLVLLGAGMLLLVSNWHVIVEARWEGLAALAGLIVVALAIGHTMGGPVEEERTALAIACATRHIGIAVLVATSFPGPRTAAVLTVYIATSVLITLPYMRWRKRLAASPQPRQEHCP
ncbi:MAG: hypothetical protein U1E60_23540 [Reyranellaceae bacterium]